MTTPPLPSFPKAKLGFLAALVSTVFISAYSTLTKILLQDFSTYSLAAIAQIFSVITLLLFFGALPEYKKLQSLSYREMAALIAVGVLSAVIQPLFLFKGLLLTSAINGVLIGRTQMVMVGIISALWLREKVGPRQITGTIVMFGGAYFIATKGLTQPIAIGGGDSLLFAAAFFGAFSTNVFKRYLSRISPHLTVLMRNTLGMILNLTVVPLAFGFQHNFQAVFNTKILMVLIVFTLVVIVGAQYLWYKSVEMIPATRASLVGMTSPLFGVMFAMTILGERLTYYHIFGGGLIVVGLVFATLHGIRHPNHAVHAKVKHWVH